MRCNLNSRNELNNMCFANFWLIRATFTLHCFITFQSVVNRSESRSCLRKGCTTRNYHSINSSTSSQVFLQHKLNAKFVRFFVCLFVCFLQNTSCIRKPQDISGVRTPCTLPLHPPLVKHVYR